MLTARREKINRDFVNPLLGTQEEMIERNQGLIKRIALKWWNRVRHMHRTEYEDLYQEAAVGMIVSYHGYRFGKVAFNTYAVPKANRIVQLYIDYRMSALHVPVKKRRMATFKAAKVISANSIERDTDEEIQESLPANPTDFTHIQVQEFIGGLTKKEQRVLALLMDGYNYREIAKVFGITFQAVGMTVIGIRKKYEFWQKHDRHRRRGEKDVV